eukprot:SAG22_NODE_1156_length_5335_cov_2.046600_2_plen_117_part_00
MLAACERLGVKVHVAGIFGGFYRSADGSKDVPPSDAPSVVERWRVLAARHAVSLEAVAVNFATLPTCVSKVVLGMKTAAEVHANLAAASTTVPARLWAEAQAEHLLPPTLALQTTT